MGLFTLCFNVIYSLSEDWVEFLELQLHIRKLLSILAAVIGVASCLVDQLDEVLLCCHSGPYSTDFP